MVRTIGSSGERTAEAIRAAGLRQRREIISLLA
jgi:hypothetical protein